MFIRFRASLGNTKCHSFYCLYSDKKALFQNNCKLRLMFANFCLKYFQFQNPNPKRLNNTSVKLNYKFVQRFAWVKNFMDCKVVQNYVVTPIKLGQGCFGTVYRGYVKNNKSQLLAVKTIPLQTIKNEELIKRQIQILMKLKSPNIVKFYKPAKTKKHLYFFLEYCETDLKNYVKGKGGKLSEDQVINILQQVCNGFKQVHKKNIIHRDIKPANFLIHKGVIKIADFGFARTVENVEELLFLTFLGSPLYMAPQILAKQKFSSKCDIWSLGVTIFQILYGRPPYNAKNPKELLENIRNNKLKFPDNIKRSQEIQDLLSQMLTIPEQQRISWTQLFEHPLIKPFDPEKIIPSSQDKLIQSYNSAKAYLSRNKVVSKTTKNVDMDEIEKKEETQTVIAEEKQDFVGDVQAQEEQLKVLNKIQQIDEEMRYKRNVSVYLNVQCNSFFTITNQILDELYFYIGLYLLLSYQINIHGNIKKELQSNKPLNEKIPESVWVTYLKSSAFTRITKLVETDLKHLEAYFGQVKSRVTVSLKDKKYVDNKSNLLTVFNKYYSKKQGHDHELYQECLLQVIKLLRSKNEIKDKFFITKMTICTNPFKYLSKNLDFGLFYESQEEELEKIVAKNPELKI